MYTIGLIKTDSPRILLNPQSCATVEELYTWLKNFFNDKNFDQEQSLSLDEVRQAVDKGVPNHINFEGFNLALMFGNEDVMLKATDEFIYIE